MGVECSHLTRRLRVPAVSRRGGLMRIKFCLPKGISLVACTAVFLAAIPVMAQQTGPLPPAKPVTPAQQTAPPAQQATPPAQTTPPTQPTAPQAPATPPQNSTQP